MITNVNIRYVRDAYDVSVVVAINPPTNAAAPCAVRHVTRVATFDAAIRYVNALEISIE